MNTVCPHQVDRMRGLYPRVARQQRSTCAKRQAHRLDQPYVEFAHDDKDCWGLTASEGPGPDAINVAGVKRQFLDYAGRGVPYGPDDGTIAPWAVAASLPFAPEIVLPALDYCIHDVKLTESNRYGFKASFNLFGFDSPWLATKWI